MDVRTRGVLVDAPEKGAERRVEVVGGRISLAFVLGFHQYVCFGVACKLLYTNLVLYIKPHLFSTTYRSWDLKFSSSQISHILACLRVR